MHVGRDVIEQEGQCGVDGIRLDDMVIVEGQHKVLLVFSQSIRQGDQNSFMVEWFRGLQERQEILHCARLDGIQASQKILIKAGRVVVFNVERKPGERDRGARPCAPLGE